MQQRRRILPRAGARLAAALLPVALATACTCAPGPTVVSLDFDDTLASQLAARPLLAAHGMRATFFVNSQRLDGPNYLKTSELRELAAEGHEIGGHTLNHPVLPDLPAEEQLREVCQDREALLDLGFDVESFAYPAGAYDGVTREIVRACGYHSARTSGGLHRTVCVLCTHAESIPPPDPFALRTHGSLQRGHDLAEIQDRIRGTERFGGGWVHVVFHHICDDCDDYSISTERLASLLHWLARERDEGGVLVRTPREVIEGDISGAAAAR